MSKSKENDLQVPYTDETEFTDALRLFLPNLEDDSSPAAYLLTSWRHLPGTSVAFKTRRHASGELEVCIYGTDSSNQLLGTPLVFVLPAAEQCPLEPRQTLEYIFGWGEVATKITPGESARAVNFVWQRYTNPQAVTKKIAIRPSMHDNTVRPHDLSKPAVNFIWQRYTNPQAVTKKIAIRPSMHDNTVRPHDLPKPVADSPITVTSITRWFLELALTELGITITYIAIASILLDSSLITPQEGQAVNQALCCFTPYILALLGGGYYHQVRFNRNATYLNE